MIRAPRRASAALAASMAWLLVLAAPGTVFGAADWALTRTPASILSGATGTFSLVATNTGSGKKASSMGCIVISIPSAFNVNSAVVTDASGHSWIASFSNSGGPGTTVTVRATASNQRLTASATETISFAVNVTAGSTPGAYQWTANAYNGHDCSGTFGQPTLLTVTIGSAPVNTPPIAVADQVTVAEDGSASVPAPGLLANDIDADGDPLTAQLATGPSHGNVTLAADGSFTYTPVPDFAGADSWSYRVSDGRAVSSPATVAVTITPVNDPPISAPDSYSVGQGATLAVGAPGVLANDTDIDSTVLTAELVSQPASGSLTLAATGSFTYVPKSGFSGTDSFQYRASDGSATSGATTVKIDVIPIGATIAPTAGPSPTPAPGSPEPTPGSSLDLTSAGPSSSAAASSAGPSATGSPLATPALTLARAPDQPDQPIGPIALDFAFAGMQFDWFIPGLAIGVPGLLVIAAIALQFLGALAWLPAVRRFLGGSGSSKARRST